VEEFPMKIHNIPLESVKPKKIKTKIENDGLHIPAEEESLGKARHHAFVPGKYNLPFRIDMAVKFIRHNQAATQLRLYIGKGNIYFNGGHVNCSDILVDTKPSVNGDNKFASLLNYTDIPSKDGYVNIAVIYGSEMMRVMVDDACCYTSDKLPYIELLRENRIPDEFINGIGIALSGGTNTKLIIKSITITEYENDEPEIPKEYINLPELSPFELFVKGLPPVIHDKMFEMDEFLLQKMKGALKFKRSIDKHGHLVYASPCGLQYGIREFGDQLGAKPEKA
jgi:hypothetical protein